MLKNVSGNSKSVQAIENLVLSESAAAAQELKEKLGVGERIAGVKAMLNHTALQHAFIAPIPHLNMVLWSESRFHLVLAHLMHNPMYAEFYAELKEKGHFIIMDNGAFENGTPYTLEQLKAICAKWFKPDVIVAPDYPDAPYHLTISSFNSFQQEWGDIYPEMEIMAVPQSLKGDWEGWLTAYEYFLTHPRADWIGLSILGVPNAFQSLTRTPDISFNRLFAVQLLLQLYGRRSTKKHHALGMGAPREIMLQRLLGLVDTNDSSSAIWHGLHGIKYDDSATALKAGKISIPVDFTGEKTLTTEIQEAVRYNIQYLEAFL